MEPTGQRDAEQISAEARRANRDRLAALVADCRARGTRRVKIAVTDVDGVLRGKYLALEKLESMLDDDAAAGTAGFCDCVLGWDIDDQLYDNVAFTGWHTGFPDARYRLDGSTLRQLPGEETPFLLADFVADFVAESGSEAGAALHPICPRSRLKGVLARAAGLGLQARMGFEYEFFVFRESPASLRAGNYQSLTPLTPGNFGYSILRSSAESELFTGLMDHASALDTPIEGLHCETGPGVWEAALAATDALAAADRASLFKTFSKVYFQQRELTATFMARWSMDYPGQSGHVHVSLQDADGAALFFDAADARGMSKRQRCFVAGVQRYMRELTALFAPTVNSYTRLVPGYWAPTAATWGIENRTCAIRVIPGSRSSQRVEFRAPGADANPYLAAAALLAAGVQGMVDELEPDAPIAGNAYAAQDELPVERHLPTHLREAAALLRASTLARRWFGDAFVEHFAATREWEAREYERHVNDWQLRRYFEII